MELILSKIIDLDNTAKAKLLEIKEKEENIETYISEAIEKEKETVDNRYVYKRKTIQEKYDLLFQQEKEKIEYEKEEKIREINEKYEQNKEKIIENLLQGII